VIIPDKDVAIKAACNSKPMTTEVGMRECNDNRHRSEAQAAQSPTSREVESQQC